MSRLNTWWVSFLIKYEYWDDEDESWYEEEEADARRIRCLKKDIPNEVKKYVENAISDIKTRNLKIDITDSYITTEYEV